MIEPLCIVYQTVNKVNGKRYIGMTTRGLKWRKRGHKTEAKTGGQMAISRAIRKHGFEMFEFSILEACNDLEHALCRERALISELKPEYNVAAGGLRGAQGWKHSEQSIAKMKASHLGKPGPWRGKKRSMESIAKRTATRAKNPVRYWLGKKRPEMAAIIRATWPRLPNDNPTPAMLRARLENMKNANLKRKRVAEEKRLTLLEVVS